MRLKSLTVRRHRSNRSAHAKNKTNLIRSLTKKKNKKTISSRRIVGVLRFFFCCFLVFTHAARNIVPPVMILQMAHKIKTYVILLYKIVHNLNVILINFKIIDLKLTFFATRCIEIKTIEFLSLGVEFSVHSNYSVPLSLLCVFF